MNEDTRSQIHTLGFVANCTSNILHSIEEAVRELEASQERDNNGDPRTTKMIYEQLNSFVGLKETIQEGFLPE